MDQRSRRRVAAWLLCCCAGVVAMVVLGAITRLEGAGLSIVHWRPVTGVVPPLDEADWDQAFGEYRASPEYRKVNAGMTRAAFQRIYWIEYAHRLLGRLLGAAFLVPLIAFAATGRVKGALLWRMVAFLLLGGLQGLVGWLMVHSGLIDAPQVSPLRLAAHLGLALLLFAGLLWTALDLLAHHPERARRPPLLAGAAVGLIFATALWGALVAGHRAGLAWNTFPLMNGQWVPEGLGALRPGWRNPFDNPLAVQFTHRCLAALTLAAVAAAWIRSRSRASGAPARARWTAHLMLGAAALQVSLGVATLLTRVRLDLALLHQSGAVLLLTAALLHAHAAQTVRE